MMDIGIANRICTLMERPELRMKINDIHNAVWPRFMQENDVANRAWPLLFDVWGDFQVALLDEDGGVVAAGHALPLAWDGRLDTLPYGWEMATEQGIALGALKMGIIIQWLIVINVVTPPC